VGLFIGSQSTLKKERNKGDGEIHRSTTTQIATTPVAVSSSTSHGSVPTAKPEPKPVSIFHVSFDIKALYRGSYERDRSTVTRVIVVEEDMQHD